jgi:hypothetical protein
MEREPPLAHMRARLDEQVADFVPQRRVVEETIERLARFGELPHHLLVCLQAPSEKSEWEERDGL